MFLLMILKELIFDNILAKKRELEAQKKQQNTFYNTAESNFTATRPANIAEANKISYSNNGYYTDRDGNFMLILIIWMTKLNRNFKVSFRKNI